MFCTNGNLVSITTTAINNEEQAEIPEEIVTYTLTKEYENSTLKMSREYTLDTDSGDTSETVVTYNADEIGVFFLKTFFKNFFKIFIVQTIFGILSLFFYLIWYFITGSFFDYLILPFISIIFTIASILLYYFCVSKIVKVSNMREFIVIVASSFLVTTVVSTLFCLIESDFIGSIVICFQQTTYLASSIIQKDSLFLYFMFFCIENLLKMAFLIFGFIRQKKKDDFAI